MTDADQKALLIELSEHAAKSVAMTGKEFPDVGIGGVIVFLLASPRSGAPALAEAAAVAAVLNKKADFSKAQVLASAIAILQAQLERAATGEPAPATLQ